MGKEHQDPASHTDARKGLEMMGCYELFNLGYVTPL